MKIDLIIHDGNIVTPFETTKADIAIDKGKIVAIGKKTFMPSSENRIDASGKYVLPGIVDPHVHLGYAETLEFTESETRAAACGGVTCFGIYLLALKNGVINTFQGFKDFFESKSFIDGFFHLMVIDEITTNEIPQCPEVGITSFKFNMGYKGPHADLLGITATDDGAVLRGFRSISNMEPPARALVHAENIDIALALGKELQEQGRKDFHVWNDSRPSFVEAECMQRAIYLAKSTRCPLYIVHVTIGEGVDILVKAQKDGVDVIGETCPQYLTHSSEDPVPLLVENPPLGCVNPPLRDRASNEQLWEGIRSGVITVLGSDLAPTTLEAKGNNIWEAPMGLGNNSELILPVMLSEGVNKGRISFEKAVEVCSYNPAKVFGLFPQKGNMNVGADADIVIADLEKIVTVSPNMLHSLCDWTIYDGWKFTGWPVYTILGGKVIVEEGKPLESPRGGKYIYRNREPLARE